MKTVKFQKNFPTVKELARATKGRNFILVHDERLAHFAPFQKWSRQFAHKFSFCAGENLKKIEDFAQHLKLVMPALAGFSAQENVLVAVGGGSIGDFAGFLASVLKRGVGYVNIPSTWLAAVDSAHGGKNGLNVGALKNQVGTFYPAKAIYCAQEILATQPLENVQSAFGEVIKVSLLRKSGLYEKLNRLRVFDAASLWRLLPVAVKAKYQIVQRDPYESKGIRQLLNLGHTVGHVFELERKLAHGVAVQMGLQFALEWSLRRKIMSEKHGAEVRKLLAKNTVGAISPQNGLQPISSERFQYLLKQDKKAVGGDRLRFIFVKAPGKAVIEEVELQELLKAAHEMGWAR